MDKESIGTKMINQCYRTYNGFPTLENINSLKNDIYSIDQKRCDKDCNYFIREINEKYDIKQETKRENASKALKEKHKKFLKILTKKIQENTNSLWKGYPCKAEIKTCYNNINNIDKGSIRNKNNKNDNKGNVFKIINSPIVKNKDIIRQSSISSEEIVADLSIDSENEQSYLQLDNPKYNFEVRNEIERKSMSLLIFIFLK
jgi:hypothetical protein